MNRIPRILLSAGLFLYATVAHAYLIVDNKYEGSSKNFDQLTQDEKYDFGVFFDRWGKKIRQAITHDNNGIAPVDLPDRDSGHILWNGKHFYGWAVQYHSAEQDRLAEKRAALWEAKKFAEYKAMPQTIPGGGICALYVFDQDLNKLASLKIDLPENNHGTWCNGTYGFGGAGKSVDGVLVTISYYLTGNKPAQKAADIGKAWRYMTTLIRFEEKDGKLVLKQDDSCLGNPNIYDTIPAARKALEKCAKQKSGAN